MGVVSMVGCATSDTTAEVVAKVDDGPVRIAVADDAGMSDPVFFGPESVDSDGVATVSATGLDAGTRYWYQVEDDGVLDDSVTGQLLTYPAAGSGASHTFVMAGDAGQDPVVPGATGSELAPDRISNHGVFDVIRQRALAEGWLFFLLPGDMTYYDLGSDSHGIVGGASLANYRAMYDDVLAQPNQARLMREVSWIRIWDDHDGGPNNWDGTFADKQNTSQVAREREPLHTLPDDEAMYRSFEVDRALVVIWDCRYYRSPSGDPDGPSKTMLGTDQKTWFEGLLNSSDAGVLIVVSSVPWVGGGDDAWPGYATERQAIADLLTSTGWAGRMVMLSADAHKLAIDSGASNDWGGFPQAIFASLDAIPNNNIIGYDVLEQGGREQYGTVTVTDLGSVITVRLTGWQGTTQVGSLQVGFATSTAAPVFSGDMAELVSGSTTDVFEARLVTEFQTGDDPDGELLRIHAGDVTLDGTAKIRGTLNLEVPGVDLDDLRQWPRGRNLDLSPLSGHEVFVRRGVDTGSQIVWVPLGYYRLQDDDQDDAADGPISLVCQDRMAGIVEGNLLRPRAYHPASTIGAVIRDLFSEIYPDVVIVFDDSSHLELLGRQLIVEKERYGAAKNLVDSRGKLMYWDGEGILRIEDAPDEGEPVWTVAAGKGGALVKASRGTTREGVYNAVVATGQGADSQDPVRAVAIDDGVNSPTRFGGRFGKVPRFYSSPVLKTGDGAAQAAASILRRSMGAPLNVSFTSKVNAALRPWDPVELVYDSEETDLHVMQKLKIPLVADEAMAGTAREKSVIVIGAL